MKSNFKSGIVIFLVAMLVMQVVFNGGEKAGAAHSATGTITHVNGIRAVVEAGTNKISPCYCINRNLYCQNNDTVTSNMTLDANKSFLLNAAFIYGYNVNTTINQVPAGAYAQWSKTQNAVWSIMEGKFDGTVNTIANCGDTDQEMLKKIAWLNTVPSYVTTEENTLKWDAASSKFVLELTNTSIEGTYSANASVQVDTTTLPNGVTATVNGEKIRFESTEEFQTASTVKIYKRPAEKGLVVAWDNGNGTKQPQITLDYDEAPIAKVMEMKIKTEAKPVVATPEPTPEATVPAPQPTAPAPECQAPEAVQPENQEPVQQNQEVQVQENTMEEATLDEVPKTADETNLALPLQLAGACAITMIGLAVINLIKKRRVA